MRHSLQHVECTDSVIMPRRPTLEATTTKLFSVLIYR